MSELATPAPEVEDSEELDRAAGLAVRAAAFQLLARLLNPNPAALRSRDALDELRCVLALSGDERARAHLDTIDSGSLPDRASLERSWVHWFEQGRIAPYESSNLPPKAGGHTANLADIAGFYRALGMKVSGDRPDHLTAELEFASVVTAAESRARREGRTHEADTCAAMACSFLRDHLGTWIDVWAARVLSVEPPLVWGPIAATAASFVASEARRRHVLLVRAESAYPVGDAGLPAEEPFDCGDELPD